MIAIPNMDMPEHCYECLLRQGNCCLLLYEATPPTVPLTRLDDCPIIEIDENDPMLLEFLNEFDKWRAYKELMDSIRMAQKKGEANDR